MLPLYEDVPVYAASSFLFLIISTFVNKMGISIPECFAVQKLMNSHTTCVRQNTRPSKMQMYRKSMNFVRQFRKILIHIIIHVF